MTSTPRAERGRRSVFVAFALAAALAFGASETRSQPFTLEQLSRMDGDAGDFPQVLGARTLRGRFQEKRSFTLADGSRQTLFVFRAQNCWLKERTPAEKAVIDCRGGVGPGVFIPVLFVTSPSRQRSEKSSAPDIVLRSRYRNSLADFVPEEVLANAQSYGGAKSIWIRLLNPQSDSLALSAPAMSAALVLCVPVSSSECQSNANALLANLADAPDQAVAEQPPPPAVRPPAPPPVARAPSSPPSTSPASPAAPPRSGPAPAQATPAAPPRPPAESPTQASSAQLHYVIRPAAGSAPADWTPTRTAKRLVALLASTQSEVVMKTRDGVEVHSSLAPELTRAGDAVVVWSGDSPPGPPEFIFHRPEALELLPWTQPAEAQPASPSEVSSRIRAKDFVSFAEFKIAAPFLYDQWQAGIEVVTKVYGREQPYAATDPCRFSLLVPKTGWMSFFTGSTSVGLEQTDQGGKKILLSQPVITSAQLMSGGGDPLQLDVQPTNAGQACPSDKINLAAFTTATGNANAAWKLSSVPGNPSTGRMDIRTSSLAAPGRWLLGLYGPHNIGAGTEAGSRAVADAQDQIFNTLTAFLEDFRERHFQNNQPASAAVGADLALVSAADALSPNFAEKNVIIGKFRQPPTLLFRLDPEGNSRLSAFMASPGNTGAEVSFRAVGRVIRHYSDLFGNFSGRQPPIAIYVGSARPVPGTCPEWRKMTSDTAKLPGRPRAFAIVFANATADEMAQQLGENGRGADEVLGQTRALSCSGDSGSMLLFVPFPDLVSRTPEAVLRPAFEVIERWAAKVQN